MSVIEDRGDSFLMARFRDFYNEVIHQKRLIHTCLSSIKFDSSSTGEDKNEQTVSAVWRNLITLLEKQNAEVNRISGEYIVVVVSEEFQT